MFEKKLLLIGTGYKARLDEQLLVLNVGFSLPVKKEIPQGCVISCTTPTEISIAGMNKEVVTQFAAHIRKLRPPEKYKGTGIRYSDEEVRLLLSRKK